MTFATVLFVELRAVIQGLLISVHLVGIYLTGAWHARTQRKQYRKKPGTKEMTGSHRLLRADLFFAAFLAGRKTHKRETGDIALDGGNT